jgi:hypothetical protein
MRVLHAAALDAPVARRRLLVVGAIALVLAAVGGALAGAEAFFRAWLIGVLLWLGIAVGCLGIALMHQLTGGQWGAAIERFLEAGARTIPAVGVAFVPVLAGMPVLYHWTAPADGELAHLLEHKSIYLNVPFFVIRAVLYFAVWTALAWGLDRWSLERDRTAAPGVTTRLRGLAAGGLIALSLTVSFAAIDWLMSLEPTWYSTVFGAMVGIGWMLAAFAFVIAVTLGVADRPAVGAMLTSQVRIDLGNLLLTFTVLWTYLAFAQYLIIWAGNTPEEVTWYVHRARHGWQGVAIFLAVFRFLVPLFVLLSRRAKRSRRVMVALGSFLVVTEWVNTVWMVEPTFHPDGVFVHWLDVLVPVALGGLWGALLLRMLATRPVVAHRDPAFRSLEAEHA